MKIYANLHTHSTHSDGPYSPRKLAEVAKAEGYGALAITDHDTASAYPELLAACEELGLECIFGVEFSVAEPISCHMLAFNFDPEYPKMKEYLKNMASRQTDNTKCCFDEAVGKGDISGITWEEVLEFNKGIPWLCNNHVFEAMLAKGLVKRENYMAWFDKNFRVQRGKYPPSYDFLPLGELVQLIKEAGGIAIVAHPHCQLHLIDKLVEMGVSGLEAYHPDLTKEEQEEAYKIGIEKNLFIAGGSDHSGLCGGYYDSFPTEEALKASELYIEEMSAGTFKKHFDEIKNMKLDR